LIFLVSAFLPYGIFNNKIYYINRLFDENNKNNCYVFPLKINSAWDREICSMVNVYIYLNYYIEFQNFTKESFVSINFLPTIIKNAYNFLSTLFNGLE